MTRLTPFAMLFADRADALTRLAAAAAAAGRDARDRADFALVPEVQRLLAELESPALIAELPDAAAEYLELLHAMYRFDAAGRRVIAPSKARLEPWLDRLPPAAPPLIPGDACYVQLPETWCWAQLDAGQPHEPLDGMFLSTAPRGDEIAVVGVLGMRPERGGFTQVSLHAHPDDFAAARAVRRAPPFAPLMAGGASAGFRSVATAAELLTLVHLALVAGSEEEA